MSLQMFLGGRPVSSKEIRVMDEGGGDATGTFELSPSVTIHNGDTISFKMMTKVVAAGVVTSITKHPSGALTGAFASGGLFTRMTRTPASGKVHRWDAPEVSEADQRMIDEFLIESFARGFVREQAARD